MFFFFRFHGLATTAIVVTIGAAIGETIHRKLVDYKKEERDVMRHYIMLHPDRFPEPEHITYGDKRYFYPWNPHRRN